MTYWYILTIVSCDNIILRSLNCYLISILLIGSNCNNEDIKPNDSVTGKVIGEQLCDLGNDNNFYLIQILDSQVEIGQSIKYYDGKIYDNVAEVNNLPGAYKSGGLILCFEYEIPKNRIIPACTAMFYTFNVPQISITKIIECDCNPAVKRGLN